MLEISGIKAGYGAVSVLQGVSMRIDAGEIVALLGSNGVGKSTLNNVISGIVKPREGTVRLDSLDITGKTPRAIVEAGISQVPEGRRVFPNLSVRANLELGAYCRARERMRMNFERICVIFPRLKERLGQLAGTLSGGEQQMLAIGRGLMAEPKLLILDEPSLGLSPLMVEEMFKLIVKINQEGLSVLLVEQNVVQSLCVASRAYVLEQGRIALEGSASEMLADPRLRKTYLGL